MLPLYLIALLLTQYINVALANNHSIGYCNTFDNCGKKSIFGKELPCSNYTKAQTPDVESRERLQKICGQDFEYVCCSPAQIESLESNLKRVDAIISSCPACHKNFYDFFCQFSCSPNESTFVEIVKTENAKDTGKEIVTEINQYVDPKMAEKFFDSCKNVKFSATNGFAMDLIGGGAKNYSQFLKFLGDEKPLLGGSPYQINFKYKLDEDQKSDGLILRNDVMYNCDDEKYKCACTDCEASCPKLPHAKNLHKRCTVGIIPCFSFSVLTVLVCLIVLLGGYHVYLAKAKKFRQRSGSYHSHDDGDEEMISPLVYVTVRKRVVRRFLDKLNSYIQNSFAKLGRFCSTFPGIVIGFSLIISLALSLGIFNLQLETNPINLWVSPNEPAYINQQYFEKNFGEWFRVEQVIISSKNATEPIFNWQTISWWFEQELKLENLNKVVSLSDICFKPLDETCAIESFTQYFHGDINEINEQNWRTKLQDCANAPVNCLPTFQQPLKPQLLFDNNDISKATAFTVTILINNNSTDTKMTRKSEAYEHSFQEWAQALVEEGNKSNLDIAYSTEVSLTEELNQSSNTDVRIIVISYLAMFIYASLALGGKLPNASKISLVKTRFTLGLCGIIIILLSVTASVGLFSFVGLRSTLIIAEVIPFLVLAIGVDNIFLIVHELHKISEHEPDLDIPIRIAFAMRNIGPSCFISAILQISMFLLATAVDMPAVKNFAIYSAGAVAINFILQMTCFVSLLALDQQRMESNRVDCAPWITIPAIMIHGGQDEARGTRNRVAAERIGQEEEQVDGDSDDFVGKTDKHLEYNFSGWISDRYAPYILGRTTRPKILTFFILWLGISLSLFPGVQFGLDQRIALPRGSYLINYFNSIYDYFNTGPPVFFVVKDLDVRTREHQKQLCGKFPACNEFSLANILEQEFKRLKKSMIAEPTSNWLDDFFTWLNPDLDQCCRFKKSSLVFEMDFGTDIDIDIDTEKKHEFCTPNAPDRQCQTCYAGHVPAYGPSMEGLPQDRDFMFYFNQWIQEPSDPCPLGGKAPYSNSISRTKDKINASYFRTSHTPLRSQDDFIAAYKHSIRIVDEVKKFIPSLDIFSWSPFYVYFVQYVNIVSLTFGLLTGAIAIIWAVCTVLLGSIRSSTVMTITIASIMINMGGVMSLWGISLNAVSLVNLVICCGLAVEFTIHITRAYTVSKVSLFQDESEEAMYNNFINYNSVNSSLSSSLQELNSQLRYSKAFNALVTVGGSIIGGITITKLIGITILAFTRSKIFEVYYFRMWFALIVIAAVHSLVLLPILLSYFGDLNKLNTIVYDGGQFSSGVGIGGEEFARDFESESNTDL